MKLSTQYKNKKIEFELEYRNRKTLAIQVELILPDYKVRKKWLRNNGVRMNL